MLPIDPALIALASEQGLLPESGGPAEVGQERACAKCGVALAVDRQGRLVDGDGEAICTEDDGPHEPG